METEILEYVRKHDNVTFAELAELIPSFKGNETLPLESHPSILLWAGLSRVAKNTIGDLTEKGELFIIRDLDGAWQFGATYVKPPHAKNIRDYKSPRWLPVVLTYKDPKLTNKRI